MKIRLKQIAIAMTNAGVIGAEDNLLFSSQADLSRFARFTEGTVLIAGRVSAQEMINCGARVKASRPMIVITQSGVINGTNSNDERWIYYAPNLEAALKLAQVVELDHSLNGYTVVGGARVYDEYMDLIDAGKVRPNYVYVFGHNLEAPAVNVKIKRDFSQLHKLLQLRMVNPSYVWSEADVVGKDWAGNDLRTQDGRFNYLYDKAEIDPYGVRKVGTHLRIDTDGGEVCIDTFGIAGWSRKTSLESVDVNLTNGLAVNVRPRSHAGLNSLLLELNMTAF